MVKQLEKKVRRNGAPVFDNCRVVDIIVRQGEDGAKTVAGLLVLRRDVHHDGSERLFLLFSCQNIVYATGGGRQGTAG
jgi:succinate dehydrogenase/fumarate reductase flavoprotein subunit